MNKADEKKKALEESSFPYEITLTVKAVLKRAPDVSTGSMGIMFADTSSTIRMGEKRIGEVNAIIGGGVEVSVDLSGLGLAYRVSPIEFWNALEDALLFHNIVLENELKKVKK